MTDLIPGVAEAKIAAGLLKAMPWIAAGAALFSAGVFTAWKAPWIGADARIASVRADGQTTAINYGVALNAFNQERVSFGAVNAALIKQNKAVVAWGAASAVTLSKSAGIAAGVAPALALSHALAAPVLAVQTGATACERAEATDAAFLKVLP